MLSKAIENNLQIRFYYEVGKTLLQNGVAWWYYKVRQVLLQSVGAFLFYKAEQLVSQSKYYRVAQFYPQDQMKVKLVAYCFHEKILKFISTYLKNNVK